MNEQTFLIPANWKRNNIGFARLALAVAVIFSHAYPLLSGSNNNEPVYRLFPGYASIGRLAVFGFFTISGLLISKSWLSNADFCTFARNRFARIWPGFVVASAVTILLIVPLGTDQLHEYAQSLHSRTVIEGHIGRAVLLQPPASPYGFETNPIPHVLNGSLWTIIYEFSWYGVVAMFGMAGLLKRPSASLIFALVMLIGNWLIQARFSLTGPPQIAGMTLAWWTMYGTAFTAGMAALAYRERIPRHPALLAFAMLSFVPAHYHPKLLLIVLPVSYTYVLFWFCFSENIKLQRIGTKNDLSYGIYLYAFAIEQLLVHWSPHIWKPVSLGIVTMLATVPFALFSWFCVEKPTKDLAKRQRTELENNIRSG